MGVVGDIIAGLFKLENDPTEPAGLSDNLEGNWWPSVSSYGRDCVLLKMEIKRKNL